MLLKTFNFGFAPIGPESDKAGFAAWVQELHAAFSPKGIDSTARNNFLILFCYFAPPPPPPPLQYTPATQLLSMYCI